MIVAAVLNYFLFFGKQMIRDVRQGNRRMRYQAATRPSAARLVHRCRVCGLTSEDAPRVAFHYCSQCEGQCCYCPDHIRDHEHVVQEIA